MSDRITEFLGEEAHTYLLESLKDLYKTATPVRVAYESADSYDRQGHLIKAGHYDNARPLLPVTPTFPSKGGQAFYAIDVNEWNAAAQEYHDLWAAWKRQGERGKEPTFTEPVRKRFLVEKCEKVVVGKPFPAQHPIVAAAHRRQPTSSWA